MRIRRKRPRPAAAVAAPEQGAMVPLISSFMLSTKVNKKAWPEPVIDATEPYGYRFQVRTGAVNKADEEQLKKGTKTGRGTHFKCILTGAAITPDYVRGEGGGGRLSVRLMAGVAE